MITLSLSIMLWFFASHAYYFYNRWEDRGERSYQRRDFTDLPLWAILGNVLGCGAWGVVVLIIIVEFLP